MKDTPLRIGLIGFGRQGRLHYHSLQSWIANKTIEVSGVCDVVAESHIAGVPFFQDAHELITTTRPDVIILTVPNALHFSFAKFALEHGCDVIKE